MVKKRLILLCLAGLLVSAGAVGGTMAEFHTKTQQKGITQITTKSLSIEVQEERQEVVLTEKAQPGDAIDFSRNIVNNAEEGYDVYTRVTIYKRWNSDELDSGKIHLYQKDYELVAENSEAVKEDDWILWYQDAEQVILYYRKPLAFGETTGEILTSLRIDSDVDNNYAGAEVILEFEVDAVQQTAAKDAIAAEWGVYPQIDENGYLVSISE